MNINQTIGLLLKLPPTALVKRLAVPLEVGFLFPTGELESYLITHDFKYSLIKTGGIINRKYVLVVTNSEASKLLQLVQIMRHLEDA